MPLTRDRCICIRKVEYSETSQILTLFSREHGRLQLIAKGAHRRTKIGASKFDGGVDLLDLGEAIFSHAPEKELPPLTEWRLVEGHPLLRRDLRSMHLALYAAEILNLILEAHDPHRELFDRFERTLGELGTERREESLLAFELDLLRETGYLPELVRCGVCGTPLPRDGRAFFSPARGGVICRNCEMQTPDRMEIDPRLLGVLNNLLNLPRSNGQAVRLPRLTRHQTDPINAMLAKHLEHTLGRRCRLLRWVLDDKARR